jgi:hypothetical protein
MSIVESDCAAFLEYALRDPRFARAAQLLDG